MKRTIKLLTILFLWLATIMGHSQNFIGDEKEISIILENIKSFSESVMESDYEKIVNAYTSDAKIFPSNTKIITGREAIVKYWTLPDGTNITHHKIIPEEIKIIGDEAYDYGYYEGQTRRSDGNESNWKGKYVIVWRRVDNDWKMYLDIWNRVQE